MTDLLLTAPGHIQVGPPTPPPTRLGADHVLVEVDRLTLCGSDYRLFDGTYGGPRRYPIRFGHEWAGRVLAAGAHGESLVGASVTGDCSRWCGCCPHCMTDRNLCANIEKFGLTVDGFSTRLRTVHQRHLYVDRFGLGAPILALAEFFAVALHGLRRVAPDRDATALRDGVLIVGAGALGLASYLLLSRYFGVGDVVLAESDPVKVGEVRCRFPDALFTDPLDAAELDSLRSYQAIRAAARYGCVVECSGTADGFNAALARVAQGGRMLCFGLGSGLAVRTDLLVTKGVTVVGSIGGTGEFEDVLAFFARHGSEAYRLVTATYPAERAERALVGARTAAAIKTQLTFGGQPC
jgi:L-iditol 2-dehydrogenase